MDPSSSARSETFSGGDEMKDVPVIGSNYLKDPRSKAKYNLLSRLLLWYVQTKLNHVAS